MGNPVGIGHSQSDEGKDAKFGVQYFARFGFNLSFFGEQIVEVVDKILRKIKDVSWIFCILKYVYLFLACFYSLIYCLILIIIRFYLKWST